MRLHTRAASKCLMLALAASLLACTASTGGTKPEGGGGSEGGGPGGGGGPGESGEPGTWAPAGPASTCDETPADRPLTTPLTVCSRTVPEAVSPAAPACNASGPKPQNCTAHAPCGAVTGCTLERNQTIASKVTTSYAAGPAGYTPPAAPHWSGISPVSMGGWMHGQATGWFERPVAPTPQDLGHTDQPGSCGIPGARSLMIAAIASRQFGIEENLGADRPGIWNYAYWCGACAELVGRSGKRVRVQIVTQCTECGQNAIDIPANLLADGKNDTPFNLIDDPADAGNVCSGGAQPVDWRIVPCEVCGGIVVEYLDGFDAYTPAVRIHNHRLPVVDVEAKHDGAWTRLQRSSVSSFFPPRSPSEYGATITGSFPPFQPGKHHEATSQF
jgi:hypothetical protein